MYSILHHALHFSIQFYSKMGFLLCQFMPSFSHYIFYEPEVICYLLQLSMASEGTGTKTTTITTFPFSTAVHVICVSSSWFWLQTSTALTTAKTTELFKDYSGPNDYYRLVVINVLPRHTQAGRTSSSHTHCLCVTRKDIESIISRLSLGIQDCLLLLLIS